MRQIQALLLNFQDIKRAMRHDTTLSKVLDCVKRIWTKEVPGDVQPYAQHQNELSIENGCLSWGTRVVIRKSKQGILLQFLRESHPGITLMKALAKSYVWWIGLDKYIESMGRSCETCQAIKSNPAAAPLHPWVWPDTPRSCIHVYYARHLIGKMFL